MIGRQITSQKVYFVRFEEFRKKVTYYNRGAYRARSRLRSGANKLKKLAAFY